MGLESGTWGDSVSVCLLAWKRSHQQSLANIVPASIIKGGCIRDCIGEYYRGYLGGC